MSSVHSPAPDHPSGHARAARTGQPATGWLSKAGLAHLSPQTCSGLDRMRTAGLNPAHELTEVPVARLAQFADGSVATNVCRICAVRDVVLDILSQHRRRVPKVFVTFTLANPRPTGPRRTAKRPPARDDTAEQDRISERRAAGAHDLARIASRASLLTASGAARPAAFGFIPRSAVDQLNRIITIEVRDGVTTVPSAERVRTFWAMKTDPATTATTGNDADPWHIAEMIFAQTA